MAKGSPLSGYLDGRQGIAPWKLQAQNGPGGVEKVIEVEMDAGERKLFDASVQHVRTLVEQIQL